MTRYNFRDVQDRFGHIDGEVVSAVASFDPRSGTATARVVLKFYPWWEHPSYLEALEAGARWGFKDTFEGAREIVVDAIDPVFCALRLDPSAEDIAFLADHPVLWQFQDDADIVCNTDCDRQALITALLNHNYPYIDEATLLQHLSPYSRFKAPYSLGRFPFTLFHLVKNELERMNVRVFITREPVNRPSPVAFFINDEVVMIASDFSVEVPEFEHRPEWFKQ
jgi:hypothetical protein